MALVSMDNRESLPPGLLKQFSQPERLFSRTDLLGRRGAAPKEHGFYGWYFSAIPDGVPSAGCIVADGSTLLYIGIAPSSVSSTTHLRSRLAQHLRGNASGSTLRLSLGCLLSPRLGIELRSTSSGKRRTFGPGEQVLSDWIAQHARVAFHVAPEPWRFESQLVATLSLPLNLEFNEAHAFRGVLSGLRTAARRRAAVLPMWPASARAL
jgi:hypothetical protein